MVQSIRLLIVCLAVVLGVAHGLSDAVFEKLDNVIRTVGTNIGKQQHHATGRSSSGASMSATVPPQSVFSLGRMGEASIVMSILTDDYPDDIGFAIVLASDESMVIASQNPGFLSGQANIVHTETFTVTAGEQYKLTIYDGFIEDFNSLTIYSGAETLVFVVELDSVETVRLFTVPATVPGVGTTASGGEGGPTVSPSPTHAPTSCVDDQGEAPDGSADFTPRFMTENTVAASTGASAPVCGQHTSYVDCTNERAQDCQ
jgi:hypothetical protein